MWERQLCPHDMPYCYYTFSTADTYLTICKCCGIYGKDLTATGFCVFCNAEPKPKPPKQAESLKVYFHA